MYVLGYVNKNTSEYKDARMHQGGVLATGLIDRQKPGHFAIAVLDRVACCLLERMRQLWNSCPRQLQLSAPCIDFAVGNLCHLAFGKLTCIGKPCAGKPAPFQFVGIRPDSFLTM